jgi:hypothetical protein
MVLSAESAQKWQHNCKPFNGTHLENLRKNGNNSLRPPSRNYYSSLGAQDSMNDDYDEVHQARSNLLEKQYDTPRS